MGQNSAMKLMFAAPLALLAVLSVVTLGCADTSGSGGGVNVVKGPEPSSQPTSGISPDKEAEIQLLLQQRNPSTLKCYSDVLNEKHDRAFKGSVAILITLEPAGDSSKASDVKIVNSTLNDKEVHDCLIGKLKEFEFPKLDQGGTMQYVYHFQPAY